MNFLLIPTELVGFVICMNIRIISSFFIFF